MSFISCLADIKLSRLQKAVCRDIGWIDILDYQPRWVRDCSFWSRNGKTDAHAILLLKSLNHAHARKRAITNIVDDFLVILRDLLAIEFFYDFLDLVLEFLVQSLVIECSLVNELL